MTIDRKSTLYILIAAIIFGAMNALYGGSALSAIAQHCPDGPDCAPARNLAIGAFSIASIGVVVALWAGWRLWVSRGQGK